MAHSERSARFPRTIMLGVVLVMLGGAMGAVAPADARPIALDPRPHAAVALADRGWLWPLREFRPERPYEAPAHRYASGHRGIDIRTLDDLTVRAPADGAIAFSGTVAERGVLTIDHGDGLVSTLEPVESSLEAGVAVTRGEAVGTVALGGHAAPGSLHLGVRLHGEYINPLILLGGVPRAVLLPCC